jgi:hypothetical protein
LRNRLVAILLPGLSILFLSFRAPATAKLKQPSGEHSILPAFISSPASILYHALCLDEKGLSEKAFDYAYKGYHQLLTKNKISNTRYLTICDFSQSSRKKRLYVIDMENAELVMQTYVAHGQNSGREFASRFSNKPSSLQSSLGFYITKNTYKGEHGLALRMEGMEKGFNDNALRRGIVIHGATYIGDEGMFNGSLTGRSFGCPAVPKKQNSTFIGMVKDGSCFFIYHPSKNYLQRSKILND